MQVNCQIPRFRGIHTDGQLGKAYLSGTVLHVLHQTGNISVSFKFLPDPQRRYIAGLLSVGQMFPAVRIAIAFAVIIQCDFPHRDIIHNHHIGGGPVFSVAPDIAFFPPLVAGFVGILSNIIGSDRFQIVHGCPAITNHNNTSVYPA